MPIVEAGRMPAALKDRIEAAQAQVRSRPDHADSRAHLFQWLAVAGDWTRARAQLDLCARLVPDAVAMLALYRSAIDGESERQAVFAGTKAPEVFWVDTPAWIEDLALALQPGADQAAACARARDTADATPGTLVLAATGAADVAAPQSFTWIGDGDSRLAPVCEVIAGGRYGWLPFSAIRELRLSAPQGLCDLIWAQARVTLADGREQACLIPARYPAPAGEAGYGALDEAALMSRRTTWRDLGDGVFLGDGQKMWMTDAGEYALLDVREVSCGVGVAGLAA
ncbi:Protein of avirulence locus ImpE [plant metagenome]|uniref:Protein of avirulence locus ImpE n=1 Tax=plant metagenome TaxID=1297885 RepID=A0A484SPW8_9ZZZZ